MQKGVDTLSKKLLAQIYTTTSLKVVSDALEEISQNRSFKEHATSIATDSSLTKNQKKTQLTYLVRSIEIPMIYQFLLDQFDQHQYWLFSGGRIDYLDRFVQSFQNQTENIQIVYLETAIALTPAQTKKIAHNLSDFLGAQAIINPEVVPHLLAGFKIKIENMIFDYTLHTKYMQFQKTWISSLKKTESLIGRNVPEDIN